MNPLKRCALVAVAVLALLPPALPAAAQDASPFLPTDHWALEAVRRLNAAGLAGPGVDPVSRSLTVAEAIRRLETAAEEAAEASPEMAALVESYRSRLAAELGVEPPVQPTRRVYGEAFLGYATESGVLEPGTSTPSFEEWFGPRARSDAHGSRVDVRLAADVGSHLAAAMSVGAIGSHAYVDEAYLVTGVSALGLWLGRRPVGYRVGRGGGVVLDSLSVDGLGLFLTRPVDLPVVGPIRLETDLSRVDDNGTIGRPYFWSSRLSLQPHPRFGMGVTRGVMFGGENHEAVTLRNVLYMIVGKHGSAGSGFENQIVSLDMRYRPPLPAPVVVRLEWGFEDSAGAWWVQPGIVAGVELAAVPGLPELALGLEHTGIAGEAEGHPIWYRHWRFLDGWAAEGALLGHPLGGHGREWLLYGTADLLDRGLRVDTRLFTRDRGEFNVFAPDRAGRSTGARVEVEWRLSRSLELVGGAVWEEGASDWRQTAATVGARLRTGVGRP